MAPPLTSRKGSGGYHSPMPADLTQRFLLENLDIRGQVVRLGPLWRTILARRPCPEPIDRKSVV